MDININSGGSRISQTGRGTNFLGRDTNLLFGKIVTKNYMKMKEFGHRRGWGVPGATL